MAGEGGGLGPHFGPEVSLAHRSLSCAGGAIEEDEFVGWYTRNFERIREGQGRGAVWGGGREGAGILGNGLRTGAVWCVDGWVDGWICRWMCLCECLGACLFYSLSVSLFACLSV